MVGRIGIKMTFEFEPAASHPLAGDPAKARLASCQRVELEGQDSITSGLRPGEVIVDETDNRVPGFVDRCSSAPWFAGFARPIELAFGAREARAEWARTSGSSGPPVMPAHCWLLRAGQQRAGPFDVDDTPGARH